MCDYSAEFYKQQMYDRSIAGLSNEIWKANLSMKDRTKFTHIQIQEFALQYEEHKQQSEKLCSGNDGENPSATTVGSVNSSFHKSGKGRYNKKIDRHKNKSYQNSSKPMCNRCQKGRHSPNDCWFKNEKCEKCGKTGHLTRAHRDNWQSQTKSSKQNYSQNYKPNYNQKYTNKKKVYHIKECNTDEVSEEYESDEDTIYVKGIKAKYDSAVLSVKYEPTKSVIKNKARRGSKILKYNKYNKTKSVHNSPYYMNIKCDSEIFKFEMDSGSGVTLMPYKLYTEKLSHIPLMETKLRAETLKGTMNVVGKISLNAEYKGKAKPLILYIYDDDAEHLIAGRPWLETFQPAAPWIPKVKKPKVNCIKGKNVNQCIKKLKKKYSKVFDGKPGHLKGIKVHVEINEDCPKTTSKPKRSLLYNLKDKTDK